MPHPIFKRVASTVSKIFGEPAVLRVDETGEERPVRVIFQENFADFDANGVQVNERAPTAWIESKEAPGRRDVLVINGEAFRLLSQTFDGVGLIRCDLGRE